MPTLYFENKRGRIAAPGQGTGSFIQPGGVAYKSHGHFVATELNHGGNFLFVETDGGSLKDWVAKTFGDTMPVESQNEPGVRYKRIARPVTHSGLGSDLSLQEQRNGSFIALRILLDKLESLFETVEPNVMNSAVYGHRIRELLLLACMEVESSWKAVLNENGYTSGNRDFTTKDYVKLCRAMILDGYELSLQAYSAYPAFCPFAGWDVEKPTVSLSWYDAYNKTKHDRERNLKCGNLDNAIHAVGAAVVMFFAQFGFQFFPGDPKRSIIESVFRVVTKGMQAYERDFYVTLYVKRDDAIGQFEPWKVVNCPF